MPQTPQRPAQLCRPHARSYRRLFPHRRHHRHAQGRATPRARHDLTKAGWGKRLLFNESDVMFCPLPLFHVFAAYPMLMSAIASGCHIVFPTPAGYRGEGVFDNFWQLIERWKITYMATVPTALSALLQRPVNADISTLRGAFSGSAPLPIELFNRFEKITGVQIVEGYGLTECTCLVSHQPARRHQENRLGRSALSALPCADLAKDPRGISRLCGG